MPTIATRLVAPLLETYAARLGEARAHELRTRFAISEPALRDPEARYPLPRFFDLLEHASELSGDELFGMRYSLNMEPTGLDALGFLAMTSPTLGVAFERVHRYQGLLYEGDSGTLTQVGEQVTLTIVNWGPPRPAHRIWTEAAAVDIVVNGRELAGQVFDVHEVRMRHSPPSPARARELAETLAAPLRFDAEDNAIVLPAAVLDVPLPHADPALFAYFEREAARRTAALGPQRTNVLDDLHRMIHASLPEGVPELSALATRLGLSARTLQRRLAEQGTTLRKEVDTSRHELALHHLVAGLSIAEISYLLGFSEPSAFHRAFKRWVGCTPTQWRAQRASPAA